MWAVICELRWIPTCVILWGRHHCGAVLVIGTLVSLLMLIPVLVLALHADIYDAERIESLNSEIILDLFMAQGMNIVPSQQACLIDGFNTANTS